MCLPGDRQYKEAARATGAKKNQPIYWFQEDSQYDYQGYGALARYAQMPVGFEKRPASFAEMPAGFEKKPANFDKRPTRRRNALVSKAPATSDMFGKPLSFDEPLPHTNPFALLDSENEMLNRPLVHDQDSEEEPLANDQESEAQPLVGSKPAKAAPRKSSRLKEKKEKVDAGSEEKGRGLDGKEGLKKKKKRKKKK
jgi:hypothetical protein